MLDKFTKEVNSLCEWYLRVKKIVIKAESMDLYNKAYIQPLNEFRYCLDHFMRSIDYDDKNDTEKAKKSIQSAISHLQRAYADSIEWILINVREDYIKTLDNYPNKLILEIFSEYYKEIRREIENITEKINNYKNHKSIEETMSDTAKNSAEYFYSEGIVEKLERFLKELHIREPLLIEAKIRERKDNIKNKIIIPIVTTFVGAVIGACITVLFNQCFHLKF